MKKIAYLCKYVPVEILESMGFEAVRGEPEVSGFEEADALMHPNICSYVKAVLEDPLLPEYDGIVMTTCCDSMRRLFDVIKSRYPEKFVYILDLPRTMKGKAPDYFAEQLRSMIKALEKHTGEVFSPEKLSAVPEKKKMVRGGAATGAVSQKDNISVGIIGARYPVALSEMLKRHGVDVRFDLSCTNESREFAEIAASGDPEDRAGASGERQADRAGDLIRAYAYALLDQTPCFRMTDVTGRAEILHGMQDEVDGIICHTVKFCDHYSFEYAMEKDDLSVPVLKLETDLTGQSEGQMLTRVEAFLEAAAERKGLKSSGIEGLKGSGIKELKCSGIIVKEKSNMPVLGIDSGSTSTNAVLMDSGRKIIASAVIRTGAKVSDSSERILSEIIKKAGISREDIGCIVSTGYGRVSIPYAMKNVTEISCHAAGARYYFPDVMTILDIGGQDSKAIKLDAAGKVTDFVMNDKCAAGTGRFLEAMARTLELSIDELGPVSENSTEKVDISSMCTVFAESEVISLIAKNMEKADIAAGVHRAIAKKACSLLSRVHPEERYMMTGGVALNEGVVSAVEERLGTRLLIAPDPEIVGAVGACIYALDAVNGD